MLYSSTHDSIVLPTHSFYWGIIVDERKNEGHQKVRDPTQLCADFNWKLRCIASTEIFERKRLDLKDAVMSLRWCHLLIVLIYQLVPHTFIVTSILILS